MKNTNKKRGFTLVELVIVIAVIAILSAVLIPTFTGIINKARQSADETAVANMNTILKADGAVEPTTLNELYNVLSENGIDAKDYTPLRKDHYFFWDSNANVVVYTDKDYKVLFPGDYDDVKNDAWISLSGAISTSDVKVKDLVTGNKAVVNSAEEFVAVMEAISDGKKTVDDVTEIVVPTKLNLMGANANFGQLEGNITLQPANGTAEISGFRTDNNLTASVNPTSGYTEYGYGLFPVISAGTTVTVKNINFTNAIVGDFGAATKNSQIGFIAGAVNGGTLNVENVTFENCTAVGCQKVGVIAGHIQSAGTVNVTNVTAENTVVMGACYAAKIVGTISADSTLTVSNSDFTGVTVKADEGTWIALWSDANGNRDLNWEGTYLTFDDVYTLTAADATAIGNGAHAGDVYAKYLNGETYCLYPVATQCDYWKGSTKTTVSDIAGKTSVVVYNTSANAN